MILFGGSVESVDKELIRPRDAVWVVKSLFPVFVGDLKCIELLFMSVKP